MDKREQLEALKKKGWPQLSGAERDVYNKLKKELDNPDFVDHSVTEQDLIDNPELRERGVEVGDKVKIAKPVTAKTDNKAQYIIKENVKHDGIYYVAGDDIAASNPALETLILEGYARKKVIS